MNNKLKKNTSIIIIIVALLMIPSIVEYRTDIKEYINNVNAITTKSIVEYKKDTKGYTDNAKAITWRFDDIYVTSPKSTYDEWKLMVENITKYGGYVGIGLIPGRNSTSGAWPEPQNLTYTTKQINRVNDLISNEKAYLWMHCWNHTLGE